MGIISKRIHQKTTDQLAAPIQASTTLPAAQVYEIADQLIHNYVPQSGFGAHWNDTNYQYEIIDRKDQGRAITACRPNVVSNKAPMPPSWEAYLVVKGAESSPHRSVQLQLLRWKTKDGSLVLRNAYESFRDEFLAALTNADPTSQRSE